MRLRGAYLVTATDVVKNPDGTIAEVHASYDPQSRGGTAPDGRKVKSTMHWVSAGHAIPVTANLYDRLFSAEIPGSQTGKPLTISTHIPAKHSPRSWPNRPWPMWLRAR